VHLDENLDTFLHFSVDDVIDGLLEVSDAGIPFSEHPLFGFLDGLNKRFGIHVDLYLFYRSASRGKLRLLSDVSSDLRAQFSARPWLRLGPHALDYETPPHAQTEEDCRQTLSTILHEIDRFAGFEQRSQWLRLHYFSEPYEMAEFLIDNGMSTLLLTDKPQGAYRLPENLRCDLIRRGFVSHKGLRLQRSHTRMEFLVNECGSTQALRDRLDHLLLKHGNLVLFTHAVDLANEEVRTTTVKCLEYLHEIGLASI